MCANNFVVALAALGLVASLYSNVSYAHPSVFSHKPTAANVSGGSDDNGADYVTPQFDIHYAQQQKHGRHESQQKQNQQQHKYPNQHPNLTLKTSGTPSPSLSIKSSSDAISATSIKPSLHSAYIYKAEVPMHVEPETNKAVNALKLANATSSSSLASPAASDATTTSFTSNTPTRNSSNINLQTDDDSSKKIIGSSVVTSVSVILNGDEPEFADALGQKVPKPQPSLQVASPIDLLNPDRYEFYTFDEHGELVKRLMTMEEIQSIVANGDGEGPTIIHHGPIEDRDPEKNVQDIVDSVQSVLNKEVESNKNSSTENLPIFDTPDVSSSWSMILPAVFGNGGSVDIFSHQKPQQIVMTPDTEIIETSTAKSVTTTTKKPRPNKRKPGQKRKSTTTTTEMTPQVIQEELDSQESVYTGMQQYQNLAATMQNYDGFSQLHLQPIYHKLPEIETTTRRVFINNQEVVKKPVTIIEKNEINLSDNLAKQPSTVQYKPLPPPHRVKKPSGSHTTTKRPQSNKQKLKRKPTVASTKIPFPSATTTILATALTLTTSVPTTISSITTTSNVVSSAITSITTSPIQVTIPTSNPTTIITNAHSTITLTKKKKKPTPHPLHSSSTVLSGSEQKPHLTAEKRKPASKPHRSRPKPTKYQHISSASDLAAEATIHQEITHNKFQHVSSHKARPKPTKPTYTPSVISPTITLPSNTVIAPQIPTRHTNTPVNMSIITGDHQPLNSNEEVLLTAIMTTNKPDSATSANIPSTSGTSGYPVPSYGISTDNSEVLGSNHYTKQPLPLLALTQQEQDVHTLQSFDQIMQTLKQPEQISEQMTESIANAFEKFNLKPVKYESVQSKDELQETANKYTTSLQNQTKITPSPTPKPSNYHYGGTTLTTMTSNAEDTSDLSNSTKTTIYDEGKMPNIINTRPDRNLTTILPEQINTNSSTEEETNTNTNFPRFTSPTAATQEESTTPTELPEFTHVSSENQMEHTTEYDLATEDYDTQTHESGTSNYASTSTIFEQSTSTNDDDTATDVNQKSEEYAEPLKNKTLPVSSPHKEQTLRNSENATSTPIFIANLKPQLNMEVIKPSEQISMSTFQTQAATVASTLIDGVNTVPYDYSSISSNETSYEISLLMSDVIHQISNTNDISTTKQTNSNDNRYSNHAQLDLSFLQSPTEAQTQKTTAHVPSADDESSNQQTHKPIFDRPENTKSNQDESENSYKDSNEYFSTTEAPEATTLMASQNKEFYIEEEENTTESFATTTEEETATANIWKPSNIQQHKAENTPSAIKEHQTESRNNYNNDSFNEKLDKEDKNDSNNNNTSTIQTFVDTQEQKFKGDREPLFESDSAIDTTTFVSVLSEDTTFLSSEENQSDIKGQFSGIKNTNHSDNEYHSQFGTTTLPYLFDEDATEHSTESSDDDKLNSSKTETATADFETTDGLEGTTSINKDSLVTEKSELEVSERTEDNITEVISLDIEPDPVGESTTLKTTDADDSEKIDIDEPNATEETTTIAYQMSEETSAELNAMVSEEDEMDESADEDPYIKLGETTTLKPELSSEFPTKTIEKKPAIILAPPKPIDFITETQPSTLVENYGQSHEEGDEEDEEDQLVYHEPKLPSPVSNATSTTRTPTTAKPIVTTTRRLSTLKPVSYFNKQPAYALYQEPAEPIYNKQSSQPLYTHQKENTPPKVVSYSIPNTQQRPMQRPPQLSNLMISSTQSTRAPVKLDPSPYDSKGLEASLANLDEDILAFAKLCNELAFSYWKSITSEKISSARSLVMSPFALTSMLSMVFLGARGSTSGEMNDVLKLDDMVTFNPHLVFKNITDSVEKSTDTDIATTAFVREIYSDRANGKVLQFFKEKTQQLYAGHVEEVNFHVVNDIIRRRTNLLVKRHTMGKVLEYLRTNSVWVNGPLATISANLFQTDCSHGSIQDRDGEIFFQVHPTVRQRRLVPIPAVLFKSGFSAGYEPNLDATVVAFGRIQDTTSVIYVMPGHLSSVSPSDNLDRLEKQLMETAISRNAWGSLLTSVMDRPGMEVQIPRFSHRSFVNATLGLQKMGLKGLFKSDYADLGGLTGSSNRDIYLSDMIQINTFSTCGEEKIADHHHVEMYPAPPLRKRNKDVDVRGDDEQDSSEAIIDFGSLVQDSVLGRGFYDDLLDPKYLELPLPLRPRQARVPDAPRLRFDKPFLYFVRHNPTGMILFMGRFNPRLLP